MGVQVGRVGEGGVKGVEGGKLTALVRGEYRPPRPRVMGPAVHPMGPHTHFLSKQLES